SGARSFARRWSTRSAPRNTEKLWQEAPMTKSGTKKMRAYVLIETAPGKTKTVKKGLAAVDGTDPTVVDLDAVTGPFDFIAVVEGSTLDAVGRLVTDEIGSIDGVTRTTTCLAVAIG